MHEVGLLTGVAGAVNAAAKGRTVHQVALIVGEQSGAVEDALYGAWPLARNGACGNATLVVTMVPATVWCPTCDKDIEIDEFFALQCPVCGTPTANLTHGREFDIDFIDVDD